MEPKIRCKDRKKSIAINVSGVISSLERIAKIYIRAKTTQNSITKSPFIINY
jgi:hypothetical protein